MLQIEELSDNQQQRISKHNDTVHTKVSRISNTR
jgi:hypothetical protein